MIQTLKNVNYWLAKQEPSGPRGYNFETFKKDKETIWDGVHNNLALKHMREIKKKVILFYFITLVMNDKLLVLWK
jgi:predicted RNA-binding protein with PUA-like domain